MPSTNKDSYLAQLFDNCLLKKFPNILSFTNILCLITLTLSYQLHFNCKSNIKDIPDVVGNKLSITKDYGFNELVNCVQNSNKHNKECYDAYLKRSSIEAEYTLAPSVVQNFKTCLAINSYSISAVANYSDMKLLFDTHGCIISAEFSQMLSTYFLKSNFEDRNAYSDSMVEFPTYWIHTAKSIIKVFGILYVISAINQRRRDFRDLGSQVFALENRLRELEYEYQHLTSTLNCWRETVMCDIKSLKNKVTSVTDSQKETRNELNASSRFCYRGGSSDNQKPDNFKKSSTREYSKTNVTFTEQEYSKISVPKDTANLEERCLSRDLKADVVPSIHSRDGTSKNVENCAPVTVQGKHKGLIFDLTTKKGREQWRNHILRNKAKKKEDGCIDSGMDSVDISKATVVSLSTEQDTKEKTIVGSSATSSEEAKNFPNIVLSDKNGKPFRRIFVPSYGWLSRNKCLELMRKNPALEKASTTLDYCVT